MNCTNCGRPMNTAGLCVYCDNVTIPKTPDVLQLADRQTLALESIAESLRNLPSKRELLAMLAAASDASGRHPIRPVGEYVKTADAIIAACKEKP